MKLIDKYRKNYPYTALLLHGSGAGSQSEFLQTMSQLLNDSQLRTCRADFDYMVKMQATATKRPPPKVEKLAIELVETLDDLKQPTWLIGKSMGGRIATLVANHEMVKGVIVFGYPFHPIGKPDRLRVDHLSAVTKPLLIVQGTRDSFGNEQRVSSIADAHRLTICWLPSGDHSFKPLAASGFTQTELMKEAAIHAKRFIQANQSD